MHGSGGLSQFVKSRRGHDCQRVRRTGDNDFISVLSKPQTYRLSAVHSQLQPNLVETCGEGLPKRDEHAALRLSAEMLVNGLLRTGGHTQSVDSCVEPLHRSLLHTGSYEHQWNEVQQFY